MTGQLLKERVLKSLDGGQLLELVGRDTEERVGYPVYGGLAPESNRRDLCARHAEEVIDVRQELARDRPVSGHLVEERVLKTLDRRHVLQVPRRNLEERVRDSVDCG